MVTGTSPATAGPSGPGVIVIGPTVVSPAMIGPNTVGSSPASAPARVSLSCPAPPPVPVPVPVPDSVPVCGGVTGVGSASAGSSSEVPAPVSPVVLDSLGSSAPLADEIDTSEPVAAPAPPPVPVPVSLSLELSGLAALCAVDSIASVAGSVA